MKNQLITIDRTFHPAWDVPIIAAVGRAFRSVNFRPDSYDFDTAVQDVRVRLINPKRFEEGRREYPRPLIARLAQFSVLTYLAGRNEKTIGGTLMDCLDDVDLEVEAVEDPLYGAALLSLLGPLDEPLQTAPYAVEFTQSQPEASRYRKNPYTIPSFEIVALSFEAFDSTWRSGRRRGLNYDRMAPHQRRLMSQQRATYGECLRSAVPQYMKWLGMQTLKKKDRDVVKLINREGLSDAVVKQRLNIPHSSYNALLARLANRGFDEVVGPEGRRTFKYNPVLDSTQRFMDPLSLRKINELTVAEAIEKNEQLFHHVASTPGMMPDQVAKIARQQRRQLIEDKVSFEAIERHDARLRLFIQRSVEQPVIGKGVTLTEVERVLSACRSENEAKDLVFKSLRFQKPVTELIGLSQLIAA